MGTVPQLKSLQAEQVSGSFVLLPYQELNFSVQSFKLQSIAAETLGNCSVRSVFLGYFYTAGFSSSRLQTSTFLLGELATTHIRSRKPEVIEKFQRQARRLPKTR